MFLTALYGHQGSAGDLAGLKIGDYITEVNGLDTSAAAFGALLPTDKEVPLKLRFSRFV